MIKKGDYKNLIQRTKYFASGIGRTCWLKGCGRKRGKSQRTESVTFHEAAKAVLLKHIRQIASSLQNPPVAPTASE